MQDEYIHMNGIKSATHNSQLNGNQHGQTDLGPSKFDRYKHQDEDDDDEMDEGNFHRINLFVPIKKKMCFLWFDSSLSYRWIRKRNAKVGAICDEDNATEKKEANSSTVGQTRFHLRKHSYESNAIVPAKQV